LHRGDFSKPLEVVAQAECYDEWEANWAGTKPKYKESMFYRVAI